MLANTTYTVRTNQTTWFQNGTLRSHRSVVSKVESRPLGDRVRSTTVYAGPVGPARVAHPTAARVETYVDTQVHHAVTYPNGTTTYRSFRHTDFERRTLELVLSSFETRVTARTTCGNRTCYRVESTTLNAPGFLAAAFVRMPDHTVSGGTLTGFVETRGLVVEYRVRYLVETPEDVYTAE